MKYLLIICTLIFFISCSKELNVKPSINVESSLAMNCLFNPDQAWKIDLIETKGVEDSLSYKSVTNASININNIWIPDDFKYIPPIAAFDIGYYTNKDVNKNVLTDVEIYNIEIAREGYDIIYASDTIPEKPITKGLQISQIEVNEQVLLGSASRRYVIQGVLNFTIENFDPSANYLVKVYFENDYVLDLFGNKKDSFYLNEALINFTNIDSDIIFNSFKGKQLNSSNNEVDISFSHSSFKNLSRPDKLILEVSRVSNVYFNYLKSLNEVKQAVQNPFSNQIVPFSNINGGYGIFAAFNNKIDTLSF